MSLFRAEVLEHRRAKLHGNVNLALPVSWQIVGLLFFVTLAVAVIFLSLAGYSRIETVGGTITPEGGVAEITALRSGIVTELRVREGQIVEKGAALAVVQSGQALASGAEALAEVLSSLSSEEAGLRVQQRQLGLSAQAENAQLLAKVAGLRSTVAGLDEQIGVQEELIATAKKELDLALGVAERGFLSRRDLIQREELYLGRRQQLTQLRQTRSNQLSAIAEAEASIRQAQAASQAQLASLATQRSGLAQSRTSAEAADATRLTAPLGGQVTALPVRVGQPVTPQQPLMLIVPRGSRLQAQLFVSGAAVAFVQVGQEVRLAIDAFPYQKFGTVPARITSVAAAPVVQQDAEGKAVSVFLATARLDRAYVFAFGKRQPLIAGMAFSARVVTERQTLLQWLFEPLFAVRNR